MKNKIIAVISTIIVIIIGFYYLFLNNNFLANLLFLDAEKIKDPSFLKDKQAVLYYSTPNYSLMGFSYAIFVDNKGETQGIKMHELDCGTVTKGNHRVFLEEADRVRIIGKNYKEFPMKVGQYLGHQSGYLKRKDLFFSLYNSGLHDSYIRYGNEKGFHTEKFPGSIEASGLFDDHIFVVTENLNEIDDEVDNSKYELIELKIQDEVKTKPIKTLKFKGELNPSTIHADEKYVYIIMTVDKDDHNGKVLLIRINKKTHHQDQFTLANYKGIDDLYQTTTYNDQRAAHMWKDDLYYIDGLGDVYTFNTKTEKSKKEFSLQESHLGEQTAFRGKYLYLYKLNEKTHQHSIDKYYLKTGKLVKRIRIKGIDTIFLTNVFGDGFGLYDFEVLK
ncbi:hypothetical protein [Marininema halotolerans]|uniref:Uncharacterized protein n=1 Tax=Marininema halotolerans TaxID=1155944 RepID=A0A1I6PC29_9BACL|nr:hypothetical protein [Marininema halotolerans]SFS37774.1 hypothetical protein SAMN05444972_101497 [Marininema halotolerans]